MFPGTENLGLCVTDKLNTEQQRRPNNKFCKELYKRSIMYVQL